MDLNLYELQVTLASLIGHEGQVRVSLLAVTAHGDAVVVQVLSEEALRTVVTVYVDLRQGIVGSRFFTALLNTRLQPGQEQLQSGDNQSIYVLGLGNIDLKINK